MIADYRESDNTFAVQDYRLEPTLLEWMDGTGGIFFRGILADSRSFDMGCGTFSDGETGGLIRLSEPNKLMSAAQHPSWNTLNEPGYAFVRAMGYQIEI